MKRKFFTLALAGMVAFSFVGTSCGDDDDDKTEPTPVVNPDNQKKDEEKKDEEKKDEEKKDEEKKDEEKKDDENKGGTEEVAGLALDLSTIWSQFSDVTNNEDGTVTLTMSEGDADWKKGEFGFVIPADKQAGNYKKFVIKYKNASAKENVGCVFHFESEQVSWIEGEAANAAKFAIEEGEDVKTLTLTPEAPADKLATVRIFDFGTGNSITIVSVTAAE